MIVPERAGDTRAKWLQRFRGAQPPRVRLFCLPPAGGGTMTFRGWRDELDPAIELVLVQLPGHETRMNERPIDDREALIELLARVLLPEVRQPFALFGHSFGALLAFELVRLLRRRGWGKPVHLFFSARRAPQIVHNGLLLAQLPDDRLLDAVQRRYGGIPPEIAREPEWASLIVPALRADVAIDEGYRYVEEPPLECGVTVFGGQRDFALPRRDLEAWRAHAAERFTLREFPGDHFFLRADQSHRLLVRAIGEELLTPPPAPR